MNHNNSGGCGTCLLSMLTVAGAIILVAFIAVLTKSDVDDWGSTKTTLAVFGATILIAFCIQLFRK